jgi:hypothetical protein
VSLEFDTAESFFLWHRLCRFALANLILSSCYGDTREEERCSDAERGSREEGEAISCQGGGSGDDSDGRQDASTASTGHLPASRQEVKNRGNNKGDNIGGNKEDNTVDNTVDRLDHALARCGTLVGADYPLLQRARAVRGFKLRLRALADCLLARMEVRSGRMGGWRWW